MTTEITMTIPQAVEFLKENGFTQDGDYFVKGKYYCAVLEFALRDVAEQMPDFPQITMSEVNEKLNTMGERLDKYPPNPDLKSMELGVNMALNLPPGEITLRSQNAQRISTFIDSSLYPIFEHRKSVFQSAHPKLAKLPCDTASIGSIVKEVYERGVVMGPALTYQLPLEPRKLVKLADEFDSLVIQLEDVSRCFILPYEGAEVWCINLPVSGLAGSIPDGIMYRIKPHPRVVIRRIVN